MASSSARLRDFLSSKPADTILKEWLQPFNPGAAAAKTRNADEYKRLISSGQSQFVAAAGFEADVEWLVSQTDIDKYNALRITLLERLERPTALLRNGGSSHGIGIVDAVSNNHESNVGEAIAGSEADHHSVDRKLGLLRVYLDERLHIVRVGDLLERLGSQPSRTVTIGDSSPHKWLTALSHDLRSRSTDIWATFAVRTDAAANRVGSLVTGSGWFSDEGGSAELEALWLSAILGEMNAICKSILHFLHEDPRLAPASAVTSWFQFVAPSGFFKDLTSDNPADAAGIALLQSCIAVISAKVLSSEAIDVLNRACQAEGQIEGALQVLQGGYLHDASCVTDITQIVLDNVPRGPSPAAPAFLVWAAVAVRIRDLELIRRTDRQQAIMYPGDEEDDRDRRVSFSAEPDSIIEQTSQIIMHASEGDTFEVLAGAAVDTCKAHEVIATVSNVLESALACGADRSLQVMARASLLDVLDSTAGLTGYSAPLIGATIAVAGGKQKSWLWKQAKLDLSLSDPFAHPDGFCRRLLDESLSRAPYELVPFLQLAKLASHIAQADQDGSITITKLLSQTPSFTQVLPNGFNAYDLPREDEDSSYVRLLEDLPLFRGRRKEQYLHAHGSQAVLARQVATTLAIPKGTTGVAIRDGRPLIVLWRHEHSGWQYVANVLSTALTGNDYYNAANGFEASPSEASEILALLATWLHRTLQLAQSTTRSRDVKTELDQFVTGLRDGFHPSRDIVNLALDIFEQQLQTIPVNAGQDGSVELLTNATLFIAGIAQSSPGRVWAHLARSQLLDQSVDGGALVAVEEATEMVTGQFDFLIACIRLYQVLIEAALQNLVARGTTTSNGRFDEEAPIDTVQEKTISAILLAFTRTLTGLFANSASWRFAALEDKAQINISLISAFSDILSFSRGYDDISSPDRRITAVLSESAQHLTDIFLAASGSDITAQAVLQCIIDTAITPLDQLPSIDSRALVEQASKALELLRLLLRLSGIFDLPRPALETMLFKAAPVFARLYVSCGTLKRQTADVLEAMVQCASRADKEPPSLTGHMGEEEAKAFLLILGEEAKSVEDVDLRVSIWRLLSTMVSSRQQSCASYLLSGMLPKDSLTKRSAGNSPSTAASVLSTALELGSVPAALPAKVATAVLRFVLLAQNFYPRVTRIIKSHPTFLDGILGYLDTIKRNPREKDPKLLTRSCYETRLAGLIGEILAICIHYAKQLGDYDIARRTTTKLAYFREFGVTPPRYNASLHTNLEKNLTSKYSLCHLQSFRRTDLLPSEFGENFCYDLGFAARLLDFDPHWSHEQSLRRELPLANIDLSLVEAQVELLGSWKLLATELSTVCDEVDKVQSLLVSIIQKCLAANSSNDSPSIVYDRLVQIRADLAFTLLQRLLKSSIDPSELQTILAHVWDAIRASSVDFEAPFHGATSEYYRSLLRTLYLALKPHTAKPSIDSGTVGEAVAVRAPANALSNQAPSSSSVVLEILERVVCHGFRSLASRLHEAPSDISPGDFVLITALLQSILSVHSIGALYQQLVSIFTSTGVVRFAASLFSWAEQLTITIDGHEDPIYGELSALFLLELSTVPLMAETMAVEGILAQLSAAHLCQAFAQLPRGAGPFDNPPRHYAIWTKVLLPLCLNLLGAVGAPLAAEVSAFLNQFAPQMARNVASLESRPTQEKRSALSASQRGAITLALATETHNLALIAFVLEQAREAGASEGVVASDVPALEWDRAAVKEELQAWLSGRRRLAEKIVAMNEAEEALLRNAPTGKGIGGIDSRLGEMIVMEFEGALMCLEGGQAPI